MSLRIILITLFMCLTTTFAWACKCKKPLSLQQAFDQAHEVVYARIISSNIDNRQMDNPTSGKPSSYRMESVVHRYELKEAFKPLPTDELWVRDSLSSCSLQLLVGHYYLLFIDAQRRTSLCHQSRSLPQGAHARKESLKQLRLLKSGEFYDELTDPVPESSDKLVKEQIDDVRRLEAVLRTKATE